MRGPAPSTIKTATHAPAPQIFLKNIAATVLSENGNRSWPGENALCMHVAQLWRYPVKSLAGEALETARIAGGGIELDRRCAILDSDPARAGKPLTARQQKLLLAYRSRAYDDGIVIRTPGGADIALDDRTWLAALEKDVGRPMSLQQTDEAVHDAADLLVVNGASLRALAAEYGKELNPLRFRPNVIVDGVDAKAFEEENWQGGLFVLGTVLVEVTSPCERCVITTIDPTSLETDPSFLRLVVERHAARFGVYCRVMRPGVVNISDEWREYRAAEARA
jgi:uncharacterized protein